MESTVYCKVSEPYVVTFLNYRPMFKWYMPMLEVKNGHKKNTHYTENGLCAWTYTSMQAPMWSLKERGVLHFNLFTTLHLNSNSEPEMTICVIHNADWLRKFPIWSSGVGSATKGPHILRGDHSTAQKSVKTQNMKSHGEFDKGLFPAQVKVVSDFWPRGLKRYEKNGCKNRRTHRFANNNLIASERRDYTSNLYYSCSY